MTNANKTPSLPPPGATWTLAGAKARLSEVINRAQAAPRARFADRILPIDHAVAVAERWGDLMAQSRRSGVALSVMDAFFAATALARTSRWSRQRQGFCIIRRPAAHPWDD